MSMISSPVHRTEIAETLAKIRSLSSQNQALSSKSVGESAQSSHGVHFEKMFSAVKTSLTDISQAQNHTEMVRNAYISGDPNTSISEVMASQMKSNIAFEGLLVVRNKLLDAYKEIMNMPI